MKRKQLSVIISAASSLLALLIIVMIITGDPQGRGLSDDSTRQDQPPVSSRVCRDNYERIGTGMDYEEVLSIMGKPHRFSKAQSMGLDCKKFVWFGPHRVSVIVYMFKGHVVSTAYEEGYTG